MKLKLPAGYEIVTNFGAREWVLYWEGRELASRWLPTYASRRQQRKVMRYFIRMAKAHNRWGVVKP